MQSLLPMNQGSKFPFGLEDLKSWTIKRTDGTVTKYVLSSAAIINQATASQQRDTESTSTAGRTVSSYSSYCTHTPKQTPLVEFERDNSPLKLWVANMMGARQTKDSFDFVIDAGDILTLSSRNPRLFLEGDEELVTELSQYVTAPDPTRILKIDWEDRAAPKLAPEFWVELNKLIYGDVMTCCMGGHGRSGTSFVCLLLVNAPDYDALDAIIHCRAVHCPRAIESIVQHEYIDRVATYLNREATAKDASTITDYKAAFLASKKPTAIRTAKMLGWTK